MTGPSSSGAPDDLNFDRAESASGGAGAAPNQCANCGRPLGEKYFTANGAPICATCRGKLEHAVAPVGASGTLVKALVWGFGASIVGAIIYYSVMRFLNLEIGLVAILTGWMVGKSMSAATAGRGGRLLQVSAGLLTYVSVAMAYFPFAMQQMNDLDSAASAVTSADSTGAASAPLFDTTDAALGIDVATDGPVQMSPIVGLVILLGFAFALPILAILGSLPGGLISAAIIGFGIMQAWQLTGAPKLVFEGPFWLAGGSSGGGDKPL